VKITGLETFVVDAGWRPWEFVAVRTDSGLTGYGECSDARNPYGVVSTVHDFEPILLGQDPRPVEMRYWDLYRASRQSPGGIAAKAIAGIELALWDYSHLSTLHSAHLCACVPNVRIMEIDVDDVSWKDELVDHPPVIERGELVIPARPGWGADLNEAVARRHRWEPGRLPGYSDPTMYRR
jgi:L-alanine-DL-glutamate epimerase-like enolase superfamily enzyme